MFCRRRLCSITHQHFSDCTTLGVLTAECFGNGRNQWVKQLCKRSSLNTISERNYSSKSPEIKTLDQFFEKPKAFDAVFFINKKDLNFDQSLKVYDAIKPQEKTINLICAMIFNCQRNKQQKMMKELLKVLLEKLESCKTAEEINKQGVRDHTWNGVLTALCIDSEFERHAIEWFFFMLNHKVAKLYDTTFGLFMNILSRKGNIEKCKEVMEWMKKEKIPLNVFIYSMMMKAMIKANRLSEAISLLDDMEGQGINPDGAIFSTLVSACADCFEEEYGKKIHEIINSRGLVHDLNVNNSLIKFYAACKDVETAQSLFEQMRANKEPMDTITWNSMIKALVLSDRLAEAAKLLQEMEKCGIPPNSVTFTTLLSGCASARSFEIGKHLHWLIESKGFTNFTNVNNALLSFYIKCNHPEAAERIFTDLILRDGKSIDIISWNYYITALTLLKKWSQAIASLTEMEQQGVEPNITTFSTLLNACANHKRMEDGNYIYSMIQAKQHLKNSPVILNSEIRFFEACGDYEKVITLFETMNPREIYSVTWHCIIRSMIASHKLSAALYIIESWKKTGLKLDHTMLITTINACTATKSLEYGKRVHKLATAKGITNCLPLNNALIRFYVKINDLDSALSLLNYMVKLHSKTKPSLDVESYNYIFEGYAQMGWINKILPIFKEMVASGTTPNDLTFTSIIRACTVGATDGKTEKALSIYHDMERFFGVQPTREHATLILELLIKMKRHEEAEKVLLNGPLVSDQASWLMLLNSCQKHHETERAAKIQNYLVECHA
ncbi:hypothetical protein C9374_014156 [Naegleria lovaniensis]|uniref:Uncharacterized protein n=1 Tax=Naegleria lovaniensis TaxID=51637 RepID=A0AA88GW98_NAELO|nr:uncharacterized protein C9374_014156 [Naegleria lovaniensis]KAG2389596.1 hypothetical protein C9374_014156 [Naegleria lovaniensis]